MAKSLQRSGLIAQIAASTGLARASVGEVLDRLAAIAYHEAAKGFTIPGICRLTVMKRKAKRFRNPSTGQMMLIGERQVLRASPLKKAKEIVVPRPADLVQVIRDIPHAPPLSPMTPPQAAAAQSGLPASPGLPSNEDGQVVFSCSGCNTILSAPSQNAGLQGECPICGSKTNIPVRSRGQAPAKDGGGKGAAVPGQTKEKPPMLADFVTFVCQECGQEIEAPVDMMGLEATCPTCASHLHVPTMSQIQPKQDERVRDGAVEPPSVPASQRSLGMTIRLDLSDLE